MSSVAHSVKFWSTIFICKRLLQESKFYNVQFSSFTLFFSISFFPPQPLPSISYLCPLFFHATVLAKWSPIHLLHTRATYHNLHAVTEGRAALLAGELWNHIYLFSSLYASACSTHWKPILHMHFRVSAGLWCCLDQFEAFLNHSYCYFPSLS